MLGKMGRVARKRGMLTILTAVLVLSLAVAGCGKNAKTTTSDQTAKETIKIGAIIDISGTGSSLGVPERDSIEMWEKQVNDLGGINGIPVEVIILDNESDETKSVLAFKKLVNEEKVVAVAGASQSGTSIVMTNLAEQNKVPLVSAAASRKIIEPQAERKWVFKTAQNDSVVIEKVIEYLQTNKWTKVAFLSLNNAYGDSGLAEFELAAKKAGITVLAKEKFGATDVDFTAQLTNVKKSNPQAMVIWAIPPSAALVTKQASELGLNIPMIQSHGIANHKFIELAGPAANGVVFPAGKLLVAETLPDSDPQKQVIMDYVKLYETPERPRSAFGGHGYDAVNLIGKAIEKAGSTDRAKVRDALENLTEPGISGVFKMTPADHSGIDKSSLVLIEIVNGKWVVKK